MSGSNMNPKRQRLEANQMRAEYDFSGAVRGKYYQRYLESTNVVVLDPDVAKRFKNSTAVNEALRSRPEPRRTREVPKSTTYHLWDVWPARGVSSCEAGPAPSLIDEPQDGRA